MSTPDRSEAAPYYFTYIDLVSPPHHADIAWRGPRSGDVLDAMAKQADEVLAILRGITEEQSLARYAPGKWSIREVLGHLNDTERLFVSRAFWFARGFDTPLPSFDQNVAAQSAGAHERPWASLVDEFLAIRQSTLSFFSNLPAEAWSRRGIASDNPFTVRALAYLTVGHVTHHMKIVRERYL